jgi:translation initiation factor IF-3
MNKYKGNENSKRIKSNSDIRHSEVRLLDANRELIGMMSAKEANDVAKERGLDLIELTATATPPVCFIGELAKYSYEQKKAKKEAKKVQRKTQMKEIQLRPNIGEADMLRKFRDGEKFLERGDRLRVVIRFRGRERARIKETTDKMLAIISTAFEHGKVDGVPSVADNRVIINVIPVK